MNKKTIVFLLIIILFSGFYFFDLSQYLTLQSIKSNQQLFTDFVESNYSLTWLIYFLAYVLIIALSIPGALLLTLLAGAIFGLVSGTILVSFASSIGATLAFLVTRYLFRDKLLKKYHTQFSKINKNINENGWWYLFSLRLIPIMPFFMINILFGLTNIKTLTFYWISQLGMLAGTIVYVNAGLQLSKIESTKDILSLNLILAFVLLALLPIILKVILHKINNFKLYKKYKKPKTFDNNIIVIGAGSGGLIASYIASLLKAKVTLIEQHKMGGDCLNTGCVPSKTLIKTSKITQEIKNCQKYGLNADVQIDWQKIINRVHQKITEIEPHDSIEKYQKLGVNVIIGKAQITSPYEVLINDKKLSTKNIIIATGAKPKIPKIKGLDKIKYLTSDNIWELKYLPKKLLVLGGGVVGCELSQTFNSLGCKTTLIQRSKNLLKNSDLDVAQFLENKFEQNKINVLTNCQSQEFLTKDNKKYLICQHQKQIKEIEFDEVLIAIGRESNIKGFGLENLGVKTNHKITTNSFLQTNLPNIYAIGDVSSPFQFTHSASFEAWFASINSLFGKFKKFKIDYSYMPRVTFTNPEIAEVGLTEKTAQEKNIKYEITKYNLNDLDRAITESETEGWVKILTPPKKDKILGVCIVAQNAGEMLTEFTLAMKYNLGLNKILGTIHPYPTWSEANKLAAGLWKNNKNYDKLLSFIEKYHNWQRK